VSWRLRATCTHTISVHLAG